MTKLFHVSDRDDIVRFNPRVAPSDPNARIGVWAIDEDHLGNQLLPRDCPRVCFRTGQSTSPQDIGRFLFGDAAARVIAIEAAWWQRVTRATLWVYELPAEPCTLLDEVAGYYLAETSVTPIDRREVSDIPVAIIELGYELRVMPTLWPLREAVITSTLALSVIRWRNAGPSPEVIL